MTFYEQYCKETYSDYVSGAYFNIETIPYGDFRKVLSAITRLPLSLRKNFLLIYLSLGIGYEIYQYQVALQLECLTLPLSESLARFSSSSIRRIASFSNKEEGRRENVISLPSNYVYLGEGILFSFILLPFFFFFGLCIDRCEKGRDWKVKWLARERE